MTRRGFLLATPVAVVARKPIARWLERERIKQQFRDVLTKGMREFRRAMDGLYMGGAGGGKTQVMMHHMLDVMRPGEKLLVMHPEQERLFLRSSVGFTLVN